VVQRARQRERAALMCARLASDDEPVGPVGVDKPDPGGVRGSEEEKSVT
jgi:hypothetical protein